MAAGIAVFQLLPGAGALVVGAKTLPQVALCSQRPLQAGLGQGFCLVGLRVFGQDPGLVRQFQEAKGRVEQSQPLNSSLLLHDDRFPGRQPRLPLDDGVL